MRVRKLAKADQQGDTGNQPDGPSINAEIQVAVAGMRSGAGQVAEGVTLVTEAAQSLRQINNEMVRTTAMVGGFLTHRGEQQSAMIDLARNVEQVATMTEQNVAVVAQTNATVGYLNGVVDRIRKSVQRYRSEGAASPGRALAQLRRFPARRSLRYAAVRPSRQGLRRRNAGVNRKPGCPRQRCCSRKGREEPGQDVG